MSTLPLHDDWAPFRARLSNTTTSPVLSTVLSVYNHAQSPAKSDASLWHETDRAAEAGPAAVELLDELLAFHGYRRTSRARWIPSLPGSSDWAVFCDVHPAKEAPTT